MKTVKELKDFLKDIPDETPLLVRFFLSDFDWTYYQDIDIILQPMAPIEKSDKWKYDSNGQISLIIS